MSFETISASPFFISKARRRLDLCLEAAVAAVFPAAMEVSVHIHIPAEASVVPAAAEAAVEAAPEDLAVLAAAGEGVPVVLAQASAVLAVPAPPAATDRAAEDGCGAVSEDRDEPVQAATMAASPADLRTAPAADA